MNTFYSIFEIKNYINFFLNLIIKMYSFILDFIVNFYIIPLYCATLLKIMLKFVCINEYDF